MRPHRPIALAALVAGAALLLTGCLDAGFPGPAPTGPATTPAPGPTESTATTGPSSPTATTPSSTPTPSETPAAPVSLDCTALLPIADVYAIDPNLSVVPLTGAPTTWLAQEAAAASGTVCRVTHATTGAAAFIAVAAPGSAALAEQRAAAGPGSPLGATGLEAHGPTDQLQVFHDDRRVTGECDKNFNPDSLRALLALAVAHGA